MLTEFRSAVTNFLAGSPWPVHGYLPDDIGAVPCIAVPRPRLLPGKETLINGSLVVLVVGNRIGNESASTELDDVADKVVDRFGGLGKSVRIESPILRRLIVTDVTPTQVLIAGTDYPAYAITVEGTFTTC